MEKEGKGKYKENLIRTINLLLNILSLLIQVCVLSLVSYLVHTI